MSSRHNFLDADNSIMERNLRFVKNDFEENLNQYFGSSGSRGNNSTNVSAPPRDYKVVLPKPGDSHARILSDAMEKRRGFLLDLGLARHEAYELAKNTNFDVNRYKNKFERLVNSGIRRDELNNIILCDIRNENSWNENMSDKEDDIPLKTPPVPLISLRFEEHDNLNRGRHEYNVIDTNRFSRNRSRSPLYSYDSTRNDRREELNAPRRSRSPKRGFSPEPVRNIEKHFSPTEKIRSGDMNREVSQSRRDPREDYYNRSRSRSPSRTFNTIHDDRRNEEYLFRHDYSRDEIRRDTIRKRSRSYSPARIDHARVRFRSSRSRSPNRGFHERKLEEYYAQQNYRDGVRRDTIREQSLSRNDHIEERYRLSRSRSPKIVFDSVHDRKGEGFNLKHDYFRDEIRSDKIRRSSRTYSSPTHNRRGEDYYHSSRSRSPPSRNNERMSYRDTIRERSLSPSYSSPRNYHRDEFYKLSRFCSPNRGFNPLNERRSEDFSSQNINFEEDIKRNMNKTDFDPPPSSGSKLPSRDIKHNDHFGNAQKRPNRNIPTQNREIPSLLTLDVFSKQTPSYIESNIHPLPSLQGCANQKDYDQESNKKLSREKFTHQQEREPILMPHKANIPIIKSGLKKPPPGQLKANPQDYWSQWWPQYKYIEYSIPKVDPNDIEVKACINFTLKRHDPQFRTRKSLLLGEGVKTILGTVSIKERNYYVRDIYKLFKYKKHLEDPNFQNTLTPQELNCIAPALRQFQIKSTMAFLHQALICRWHISLDIIKRVQAGEPILSKYARMILNEKCFHYLTLESIKELKKMCQQDWPQFTEFYKKIKATKVDIYSMGVGPSE